MSGDHYATKPNPATLTRRHFLAAAALAAGVVTSPKTTASPNALGAGAAIQPNIVLIVADDLGYGDLGSYGQGAIQTPRLDQMAAEGMRFTQFYAGSTICAPSRGTLMTGLHTGHSRITGNRLQSLNDEDVTIAEVLRDAGYRTGGFGKWDMGTARSEGAPNDQGFDQWYGYLNSLHAQNYYPTHMFLNRQLFPVRGNLAPFARRQTYSHDLFTTMALQFIAEEADGPFFLYLPYTIPHANTIGSIFGAEGMPVPSDEPYAEEAWPQTQKNHAAMITRMDQDIGQLLDTLDALGLSQNTLVLFTSDNGPHREGGADPEFFDSNGELRGIKRDLYEGGIRVPCLARWTGVIPAGVESDHVCAFWDVLPALAELAGGAAPSGIDGISFAPTLIGEEMAGRPQDDHEFLYWEFNEFQAARMGDWKAVAVARRGIFELYDLRQDPGETTDLAASRPDIVAAMQTLIDSVRSNPPKLQPAPNRSRRRFRRRWRRGQ
jgi:arylsulfatase A-like enzyme